MKRDDSDAEALGRTSAGRIWRSVVVAGAMIGAPIVVACGGPTKRADTTTATTNTGSASQGSATPATGSDATPAGGSDQAAATGSDARARGSAGSAADPLDIDFPQPRPKGRGFVLA